MPTLKTVKDYTKNLGKSFKYAAIDVVDEKLPILKDFRETNGDFARDIYDHTRKMKNNNAPSRSISSLPIFKTIGDAWNNAKQDLKSGKLYNKERGEEAMNAEMNQMFSDMNDELDSDLSDDNSGINIDTSDSALDDISNSAIAGSINSGFRASSNTISTAITAGNSYVGGSIRGASQLAYIQSIETNRNIKTGFGNLQTIGTAILSFNKDVLQKHVENSFKFYDNATKLLTEQNAMMKEMLEMQRNLYKAQQQTSSGPTSPLDNILNGGAFDINAYLNNVKSNYKNSFIGSIADIMGMLGGMGGGSMLTGSPLQFIPQAIIGALLGPKLSRSLVGLNKTLSGIGGTAIAKINQKANDVNANPFTSLLANLFKVDVREKTKLDLSKINKGPMAFNGAANQAITEVIPAYLARIESALTGQPERLFDMTSGKWTNLKTVKKQREYDRQYKIGLATRGLTDQYDRMVGTNKISGSKSLEREMKAFLNQLYEDNGLTEFKDSRGNWNTKKYKGTTEEGLAQIYNVFRSLSNGDRMALPGAIMSSKIQNNSDDTFAENNPYALRRALENGAFGNTTKSIGKGSIGLGSGNTSIIDILSKIHSETVRMRSMMEAMDQFPGTGFGTSGLSGTSVKGKRLSLKDISERTQSRLSRAARHDTNVIRTRENNEEYRDINRRINLSHINSISVLKQELKKAYPNRKRDIDNLYTSDGRINETLLNDIVRDSAVRTKIIDINRRLKIANTINLGKSRANPYGDFSKTNGESSFKSVTDFLTRLRDKPAEYMSELVNSIDNSIYSFFFKNETNSVGVDGKPIKGFFEYMADQTKRVFGTVTDYIQTKFLDPIKKKITDFLDHNELWQKTKENVRSSFRSAGRGISNAFRAVGSDIMAYSSGDIKKKPVIVGQKAFGGYIKKTGLYALSKGEAVIPSDENPYNPDMLTANRYKDAVKEKQIINKAKRQLGYSTKGYANGTVDVDTENLNPHSISTPVKGMMESLIDKMDSLIDTIKGRFSPVKEGPRIPIGTPHTGGSKDTFTQEETDKVIKTIDEDALAKIKDYIPDMAGSSAVGATAGALLLGPAGLLAGATVGAALSVAKRSSTVQNWLFGKPDKNGDRDNSGVFSPDTLKAITKYYPDMRNYTVVGSVAGGLIGPVGFLGGALLGATAGYIKQNDELKTKLFGDGTNDNKFQTFLKNHMKRFVTGTALGSIGGGMLLGGPMGMVGGMLIGGALSFMSTTDSFKEMLLGKYDPQTKTRKGGIMGALKMSMFDPLKERAISIQDQFSKYMKTEVFAPLKRGLIPLAHLVTGGTSLMFKKISSTIQDKILGNKNKHRMARWGRNLLSSKAGKLAGGALAAYSLMSGDTSMLPYLLGGGLLASGKAPAIAKKVVGFGTGLVERVGDKASAFQIKHGMADWMDAQKVADIAEKNGITNYQGKSTVDFINSNKKDKSKLQAALASVQALTGDRKSAIAQQRSIEDSLYTELGQTSIGKSKLVEDLGDIVTKGGNLKQAEKLINKSKISESEKADILNTVRSHYSQYKGISDSLNNPNNLNSLKQMGIDISNPKELDTALAYLQQSVKNLPDQDKSKELEKKSTQTYRSTITGLITTTNLLLGNMMNIFMGGPVDTEALNSVSNLKTIPDSIRNMVKQSARSNDVAYQQQRDLAHLQSTSSTGVINAYNSAMNSAPGMSTQNQIDFLRYNNDKSAQIESDLISKGYTNLSNADRDRAKEATSSDISRMNKRLSMGNLQSGSDAIAAMDSQNIYKTRKVLKNLGKLGIQISTADANKLEENTNNQYDYASILRAVRSNDKDLVIKLLEQQGIAYTTKDGKYKYGTSFAHKLNEAAWSTGEAIASAPVNTVKGIYKTGYVVTHPIKTVKGVVNSAIDGLTAGYNTAKNGAEALGNKIQQFAFGTDLVTASSVAALSKGEQVVSSKDNINNPDNQSTKVKSKQVDQNKSVRSDFNQMSSEEKKLYSAAQEGNYTPTQQAQSKPRTKRDSDNDNKTTVGTPYGAMTMKKDTKGNYYPENTKANKEIQKKMDDESKDRDLVNYYLKNISENTSAFNSVGNGQQGNKKSSGSLFGGLKDLFLSPFKMIMDILDIFGLGTPLRWLGGKIGSGFKWFGRTTGLSDKYNRIKGNIVTKANSLGDRIKTKTTAGAIRIGESVGLLDKNKRLAAEQAAREAEIEKQRKAVQNAEAKDRIRAQRDARKGKKIDNKFAALDNTVRSAEARKNINKTSRGGKFGALSSLAGGLVSNGQYCCCCALGGMPIGNNPTAIQAMQDAGYDKVDRNGNQTKTSQQSKENASKAKATQQQQQADRKKESKSARKLRRKALWKGAAIAAGGAAVAGPSIVDAANDASGIADKNSSAEYQADLQKTIADNASGKDTTAQDKANAKAAAKNPGQAIANNKQIPAEKKGLLTRAVESIKSGFKKIVQWASKLVPKSWASKLAKFGGKIIESVTKPKTLAKAATKLSVGAVTGVIGYVGIIGYSFYEGWNDAARYFNLGEDESPTFTQKVVAGICNALVNSIPVIGFFIDTADLFALARNVFGITASPKGEKQLDKDRKDSEETGVLSSAAKSIKDFGKSLWTNAKTIGSNMIDATKNGIDSIWSGIKNAGNGLMSAVGGAFSWLSNQIDALSKQLADWADKQWKTFANNHPGMAQTIQDIGNTAASVGNAILHPWDTFKKATADANANLVRKNAAKTQSADDYDMAQFGAKASDDSKSQAADSADMAQFGVTAGQGKYMRYGRGAYLSSSQFTSQLDPANQMSYNTSADHIQQSMYDSGCGPAAAANAAAALGGNLDVKSAASYALNSGYKETDGGTKPGFFKDIFNKMGASTEDISNNKGEVASNLAQGNPVVLMGQDSSGVSNSTPYGPGVHYVTATGIDGRGNMVVQDPETNTPNKLYPINKVLSKSSVAIATKTSPYAASFDGYNPGKGFAASNAKTGAGKRLSSLYRARYGRGDLGGEIFDYLHKKIGLSSIVTAGIMGNMMAESSLQPDIVQGGGHAPEITVDGQTGYGLCQWTSADRQQGLADFAASQGKSSSDYQVQCDFMMQEIEQGYPSLISDMDASGDAGQAALIFHSEFERSADTSEMAQRRADYAQQILASEGKGIAEAGTYKGGSSSRSKSGGKNYSGLFGQLDQLSDTLDSALNIFGSGKTRRFRRRYGRGDDETAASDASKATDSSAQTSSSPTAAATTTSDTSADSLLSGHYSQLTVATSQAKALGSQVTASMAPLKSMMSKFANSTLGKNMTAVFGDNPLASLFGNKSDKGGASGGTRPGGSIRNPKVGNNAEDYMVQNMPGAQITAPYGEDRGYFHGGVDIGVPSGTPVPSPVSGTVADVGTQSGGFGLYVQVKDKNGNFHMFPHLSAVADGMTTGASVDKNSIVAYSGGDPGDPNAGSSTGPHLHYEIDPPDNFGGLSNGDHIDPGSYTIAGLGKYGRGKYGRAKLLDRINTNIKSALPTISTSNTSGKGTADTILQQPQSAQTPSSNPLTTGGDKMDVMIGLLTSIANSLATIVGNTAGLPNLQPAGAIGASAAVPLAVTTTDSSNDTMTTFNKAPLTNIIEAMYNIGKKK